MSNHTKQNSDINDSIINCQLQLSELIGTEYASDTCKLRYSHKRQICSTTIRSRLCIVYIVYILYMCIQYNINVYKYVCICMYVFYVYKKYKCVYPVYTGCL